MYATLIFYLLIPLCLCSGEGVTVLSPPEIAGTVVTGPLQSFDFDITGELALAAVGCGEDLNTEDYRGKIVLFTGTLTCCNSI